MTTVTRFVGKPRVGRIEDKNRYAKHELRKSDIAAQEFLIRMVANVFQVDVTLLASPTRGSSDAARARQVAMYLAHVGIGLSLTHVGVLFNRDRTTVAHACQIVEERREDKAFDRIVDLLEQSVRMVSASGDCAWAA